MTSPQDPSRALFELLAPDQFLATEYSRGPWDPAHCHGGPVAALLARAVEGCEPGQVDWQLSRLTVELLRPVAVGRALRLTALTERPGRRVSLIGVSLVDGEIEVARARGLRIRREPVQIPADTIQPDDRFEATPADSRTEQMRLVHGDQISFATAACEHRFAVGSWLEPGPVSVWIRLTVPVIAGEDPTGAQRAVAAADFGNGVSATLPWDNHLFINPDLTVHLSHPPTGEWIGLRAQSQISSSGTGLAESALYDEHGLVGRSAQSLYVDHR